MKFKCDVCGKEFTYGNRPDGFPNGMTFVREGMDDITVCAECIEKMGQALYERGLISDEQKKLFRA